MRDSTIIYRSFYEAIKELPKRNQAEVWQAVFEFSLNFNEIELTGLSKTVFRLIKPQLEANIKRYKSGTVPKDKRNRSETEAKPKQDASETEANENKNVNKNTNENGNVNATPPSLAMCEEFFEGLGKKELAEKFYYHYSGLNWRVNGSPIERWLDIAKKWVLNEKNFNNGNTKNGRDQRREPSTSETDYGKL